MVLEGKKQRPFQRLQIPNLFRTIQMNSWANGIRQLHQHPTQDRYVIGYFRGYKYVIHQPKKEKLFVLHVYCQNKETGKYDIVSRVVTDGDWAFQ